MPKPARLGKGTKDGFGLWALHGLRDSPGWGMRTETFPIPAVPAALLAAEQQGLLWELLRDQ